MIELPAPFFQKSFFVFASLRNELNIKQQQQSQQKKLMWVFLHLFFCLSVLASFRGTVQHGLPLEIGDTVQILEKCEGTAPPVHSLGVTATLHSLFIHLRTTVALV